MWWWLSVRDGVGVSATPVIVHNFSVVGRNCGCLHFLFCFSSQMAFECFPFQRSNPRECNTSSRIKNRIVRDEIISRNRQASLSFLNIQCDHKRWPQRWWRSLQCIHAHTPTGRLEEIGINSAEYEIKSFIISVSGSLTTAAAETLDEARRSQCRLRQ